MIVFDDVSKVYHAPGFENEVFNGLNFVIERGESVGICGANGVGKSTLLRLIGGVEHPTSGKITRTQSMSWPIGYVSAFQASLTGADNAKFIARIYGRDEKELLAYVDDFAQLGAYLYEPVRTYSAGMAARLAFGVSLAIDFDCYLVDEITGAGDERFRERSEQALQQRRDSGTLIMVSHDMAMLDRYCTRGGVLYGGTLTFYETVQEAVDVHLRLQKLEAA